MQRHGIDPPWNRDIVSLMSSPELLKQVQVLDPGEREAFVNALLSMESKPIGRRRKQNKPVKWPDVGVRARRILRGKIVPNLVLLARESLLSSSQINN